MSALEDLHLRFEGPIPLALRAAAIAADFHVGGREPRSPVRLRVKSYTSNGIIDRMAEAMRRTAARGRPCYRTDLAEAGFSTLEIDRHGENARALAARRTEASGDQRPVEIPVTVLLATLHQLRASSTMSGLRP